MNSKHPLLDKQIKLEDSVEAFYKELLKDSLYYFRFIQETLLIAFDNSGNPLEVESDKNNPKIFALVATTCAFNIAKTSMDQALRGYPNVALAMSRFLSELTQSCQYLIRHPGLIDGYLKDQLNLKRVLKMAGEEDESPEIFGRFWGLQSQYSHASPDFVMWFLDIQDNQMSSSLVVNNPEQIQLGALTIIRALFSQYLIYRSITKGYLEVEDELTRRDKFIFDPKNVRTFLEFDKFSKGLLEEVHAWIVPPNES